MKPQAAGQITLIIGSPGRGHDALVADYARALAGAEGGPNGPHRAPLANRRSCLWIAPTRAEAASLRESLVDQAGAVLDPSVTTFTGFAAEAIRDAGLDVAPITVLQRRRLLGRLIDQAAAEGRLEHYAALADRPGLISLVSDAIADLQRRGLSPANASRGAAAADDPRGRDVAVIYELYSHRLEAAGLVDAQSLLTAAAAALDESPQLLEGLKLLVVAGFSDFTTIELELLKRIARRTREAFVTLPGEAAPADERRAELFVAPRAAAQFLQRELGAKVQSSSDDQCAAFPAIAHLERNLFRSFRDLEPPAPAVATSLERIQIIAASGVQAEIVEIARRVKRLLVAGARPGDVVVAFRSTRDVADRVRQVFDDYGIPATIEAPRMLASTALVRSLQRVLRLAAEDWPYRRLMQAVGDRAIRLLDNSTNTERQDARRACELCVRYAQLPSDRRAFFSQLEAWAADSERTSDPSPADAALAREALRPLAACLDRLPQRGTLERWIAALGPLADELGLLRPATEETAANWSILIRGVRAAGRIDAATGWGEDELELAEFLSVLAAVAAQAPASSATDGVGHVRVASAEAARLLRPRHLFLGGLSEQAFPAPPRGALAGGVDGALHAEAARAAEMLLFYQLVVAAQETLTLSYPALDQRAQALPASPFLVELERAFGSLGIPRTVQQLNYGHQATEDAEAPLGRGELRRGAVGQALALKRDLLAGLSRAGRAMSHVGDAIIAGIESVAQRGRRDEFGSFDGVLASPAVAARLRSEFGPAHLWSPSRLERYAECPFHFFGEHVLHLQPLPELVLASDVSRRGRVLHATLAQLYAELGGAAPDSEQLAGALVEQFHAALTAISQARPGRGVDAAIREIERRQIATWAEAFARQDGEYREHWSHLDQPPLPAHFEVRFGPASKHSDTRGDAALSTDAPFALPIPVDGQRETVQLTGQIDRIDVGQVGTCMVFNVIDYKSSASAAVKPEEIHAGRQIQLPLYALAVEQLLLAERQAVPLSVGYWSVQGKGYRTAARSGGPLSIHEVRDGKLTPAAVWDDMRVRLLARIGEMIAAIRRGEFPVYNDNAQCTAHCELRTICRIAHVRSLEKQWPLPPAALRETSRS